MAVNFHRSPSTAPFTARLYSFPSLPVLLLPLLVHTPSPFSHYSSLLSMSLPLQRSSSTNPCIDSIHLPLHHFPFNNPQVSINCPSILLHRSPTTPYYTTRPCPFPGLPVLLFLLPVRTPSPVSLSLRRSLPYLSSIVYALPIHCPSLMEVCSYRGRRFFRI